MDYKALIYNLRDYAEQYKSGSTLGRAIVETEDVMFDAADAIETMLAEQEDSRLTPKMVTCPGGWKGTRLTRYYCPQCQKAVRNDEAYCHKCGQAILFPKQEYDKGNNKIWLNFEQEQWSGPQKGGGI